jgi:hypothetical protein
VDREIVRRKSFPSGPIAVEDAPDALEDLDHEASTLTPWRHGAVLARRRPRAIARTRRVPTHRQDLLRGPPR